MSSIVFGNGTDLVDWKSVPKTRGTLDILLTCIITILLCVWTAIHLNVPPPRSFWRPIFRKLGWLILALLAPEMIVYTAWYVSLAQDWKCNNRTVMWRSLEPQTVHNEKSRKFWLISSRNQRQKAHEIMQRVNKAHSLPNPLSWFERVTAYMKKNFKRLADIPVEEQRKRRSVSHVHKDQRYLA